MTTHEKSSAKGIRIKDIILGGQDGLVNVLGLLLGVAGATNDVRIVIIAGLAGTFAESISMAAVAYTSSKAAHDFYLSELEREKTEIQEVPHLEKKEIYDIYKRKGFSGRLLSQIVNKIISRRDIWLETMMAEELHIFPDEYQNPLGDALIVGFSYLFGSIIPLAPFFFVTGAFPGVLWALGVSSIALFITGALKAKYTIGDWRKAGIEMFLIGMLSALAGYGIGNLLGVVI